MLFILEFTLHNCHKDINLIYIGLWNKLVTSFKTIYPFLIIPSHWEEWLYYIGNGYIYLGLEFNFFFGDVV